MAEQQTILVVDDDTRVREMLVEYLASHGFGVLEAANAAAARQVLATAEHPPALMLVDLAMPGEDGLSLARHVREHVGLGIIIVTASGAVVDRIVGLEIGADDYLAKPFDPRELLARIKSVLRRLEPPAAAAAPAGERPRRTAFAGYTLELDARRLIGPDGGDIALTSAEFDLLAAFAARPNRVLSRDQLLNLTQHRDWEPFDRSVDIRITRLRRKIEADPARPRLIRTVRGAGYVFVPE